MAYDKNSKKMSKGDVVSLVEYSDDFIKTLPSSGPRQALVAAIGKSLEVLAIKEGSPCAEVLLRLPSASALARSGGHMIWVPAMFVKKIDQASDTLT